MKFTMLSVGLCVFASGVFGGGLPDIATQPQSMTVAPGGAATLSVAAANATGYQWRFNGSDITGATDATCQITNAQTTNAGYYMVMVKNSSGWVPSQMAYLSVAASPGGLVPLSNRGNVGTSAQACYQTGPAYGQPITNGQAQVVAGRALDQMQPVGLSVPVANGYFGPSLPGSVYTRNVPTVAPGQSTYYRVDISYPYSSSSTYTQQSTVLKLVAGGGTIPLPSATRLSFPSWPEWPEPWARPGQPADQTRVIGETFSLSYDCIAYYSANLQWRKDGKCITEPVNFEADDYMSPIVRLNGVLTITNAQPGDAGVYDAIVVGDNWFVSSKFYVSIQTTNGLGVFRSPRSSDSGFVSDLEGAPGRNYRIESSTNLQNWATVTTLSNLTGSVTFSNAVVSGAPQFYRAVLLP